MFERICYKIKSYIHNRATMLKNGLLKRDNLSDQKDLVQDAYLHLYKVWLNKRAFFMRKSFNFKVFYFKKVVKNYFIGRYNGVNKVGVKVVSYSNLLTATEDVICSDLELEEEEGKRRDLFIRRIIKKVERGLNSDDFIVSLKLLWLIISPKEEFIKLISEGFTINDAISRSLDIPSRKLTYVLGKIKTVLGGSNNFYSMMKFSKRLERDFRQKKIIVGGYIMKKKKLDVYLEVEKIIKGEKKLEDYSKADKKRIGKLSDEIDDLQDQIDQGLLEEEDIKDPKKKSLVKLLLEEEFEEEEFEEEEPEEEEPEEEEPEEEELEEEELDKVIEQKIKRTEDKINKDEKVRVKKKVTVDKYKNYVTVQGQQYAKIRDLSQDARAEKGILPLSMTSLGGHVWENCDEVSKASKSEKDIFNLVLKKLIPIQKREGFHSNPEKRLKTIFPFWKKNSNLSIFKGGKRKAKIEDEVELVQPAKVKAKARKKE